MVEFKYGQQPDASRLGIWFDGKIRQPLHLTGGGYAWQSAYPDACNYCYVLPFDVWNALQKWNKDDPPSLLRIYKTQKIALQDLLQALFRAGMK